VVKTIKKLRTVSEERNNPKVILKKLLKLLQKKNVITLNDIETLKGDKSQKQI